MLLQLRISLLASGNVHSKEEQHGKGKRLQASRDPGWKRLVQPGSHNQQVSLGSGLHPLLCSGLPVLCRTGGEEAPGIQVQGVRIPCSSPESWGSTGKMSAWACRLRLSTGGTPSLSPRTYTSFLFRSSLRSWYADIGGEGVPVAERTQPENRVIWEPYGPYLNECNVRRFMDKHSISDYEELIARSTEDVVWFWEEALKDLGVEWDHPYHTVLDESEGFPWAKWFQGGKLNIVRNCLDRHAESERSARPALHWVSEGGERRTLTFAELGGIVGRVANALKAEGVVAGDTVGLYM